MGQVPKFCIITHNIINEINITSILNNNYRKYYLLFFNNLIYQYLTVE